MTQILSRSEKEELYNLHNDVVLAEATRSRFVNFLYKQHGVDPETYRLNVTTGEFILASPDGTKEGTPLKLASVGPPSVDPHPHRPPNGHPTTGAHVARPPFDSRGSA